MSGIVSIHNRLYTYYDLERDLQELAICYPDSTELTSLGQTLDHRQIYCLRIHGTKGFTKHAVVIQAAMHAREWKNAQLLMMMAERFLRCYGEDILWEGIPYRQLLRHYDVYILPMVNPDGVTISQFGVSALRSADQSGWRSDQPIWLRRHYRSGASAGITGKDRDTERGKTLERKCEGS